MPVGDMSQWDRECNVCSTGSSVALAAAYRGSMARRKRSLLPDGTYHLGTRGVDRCTVYVDDDDRRAFLSLLAWVVDDYHWHVHSLCLMKNHYHLVVETEQWLLSLGMQRLNGRYAEHFNRRFKRTGHLWGDRFWTRYVEDEEHLVGVCEYVVNNPVRAGLVPHARDWPWSASRYGLG
jgi:REP-associated tyrosine transposase